MRKMLVLAATLAIVPSVHAADAPPVPYPDGYRQWTHVKSMTINQGHALYDAFGGIHHIYANRKAEQGYKAGKFANGSVIVFDLHKDARKYKDTGGWGFEGFKGDSKTDRAVGANAASACYQCHTAQKDKDFVFSSFRK